MPKSQVLDLGIRYREQDFGRIPFPECGGGRDAVQVWSVAVTAAVAVVIRCTGQQQWLRTPQIRDFPSQYSVLRVSPDQDQSPKSKVSLGKKTFWTNPKKSVISPENLVFESFARPGPIPQNQRFPCKIQHFGIVETRAEAWFASFAG